MTFLGLLLALLVGNIADKGLSIKSSLFVCGGVFPLCQAVLWSSSEQIPAVGISGSPTVSGCCRLGKSS